MKRKIFSVLSLCIVCSTLCLMLAAGSVFAEAKDAKTRAKTDAKATAAAKPSAVSDVKTGAETSAETFRLISSRRSGDVDLVEKTFDAAGTLMLEIDPATHVSVASPGREEKNKNKEKTAPEAGSSTNGSRAGGAESSAGTGSADAASSADTKDAKGAAADGKSPLIQKIPMKVSSVQKYEEMFIQEGNLLQGENAKSTLGAWYFLENKTQIKIENTETEPILDLNQPFFGIEIKNGQIHFFRPGGFLTRDELDVINVQGNTLLADYILPNRDVKIGESWKQSPDTMGMLLQMDLVFNLDIRTKLSEVKKGIAILETSGWIEGSYEGNTSKINVTGKSYFDLKRGRILWFGLVIKEQRTAGFVSPGMDVTAKVQYKITPMESSTHLTGDSTSKLAFDESQYGLLLFQDPGNVWKMVLTPDWEPLNCSDFQSNLRLLRDGELVAQCSIAKNKDAKLTQNMKPEEFAKSVQEMLGDRFDSILDVKTMTHDDGTVIVRVDVAAKYQDLAIRHFYYLITKKGENPKQYTIVFTLEDSLLENFGEENEKLVQSFSWVEQAK